MRSFEDILTFWFGPDPDPIVPSKEVSSQWWKKDDAHDARIRSEFETTLAAVVDGQLDAWKEAPRSALARVIALDQFSRNIYRDTPQMYAQDELAMQGVMHGISAGHDRALDPMMRVFFYMPLMHAEDRDAQARSVQLFAELIQEVPSASQSLYGNFHQYAVQHREIVDRFGRFPHRNHILARSSTDEEVAFLEEPGSSF